MTTLSSSLERFVYPLKRSLRFEFDDIESLGNGARYGNTVRIGQTDWCLEVQVEYSEGNEKYLGVYLLCLNEFGQDESVQIDNEYRLLNQSNPEEHYEIEQRDVIYKDDSYSWGCGKFMEWTSLMEDGYVKNGKIIVECDMRIISEKISKNQVDFKESRPNDEDLKFVFTSDEGQVDFQKNQPQKSHSKQKIIEKEIALSQISENETFTDTVYVDGIPCKLGISKENDESDNWLVIYVHYNTDDESEWWRVEAAAEFKIQNRNKPENSHSCSIDPSVYKKDDNFGGPDSFIKWDDLIDPENGYLKFGRIIIEATVYIRNKYGFDKETGEGIAKPLKKMTDATITISDGDKFYVSRMILSHQSSWFCDFLSANPDQTEFVISDVDNDAFIIFLQLANNCEINIEEDKIKEVLKMLDKHKADECLRSLDFQIKSMEITDDIKMLKLIDKYSLPKMKATYIEKLQDPTILRKIFRNPDVIKLSDQLREELTVEEIPQEEGFQEEDLNEPYYTYSKECNKASKPGGSREKIQKFFVENDDAKKLLEDPELQNVGNDLLSYLAKQSEDTESNSCQITYKEFSDPSDMVIFNMEDLKHFYCSRQILANASRHFMKRFYGPDAEDGFNTIIFDGVSSNDFNLLLNHIYHPTRSITDKNLDILLPLAHRFSVMNLLDKCENYLIKTETLTVDKKSEYAQKYELEYLSNALSNYDNE